MEEYHGEDYDMYTERPTGLISVSGMEDWEMDEDEPNLIGWKVFEVHGNEMGKVVDLLIEPEEGIILFSIIEVRGIRTLLPMDMIDLDIDDQKIIYDGPADDILGAPHYTPAANMDDFYDYWGGEEPEHADTIENEIQRQKTEIDEDTPITKPEEFGDEIVGEDEEGEDIEYVLDAEDPRRNEG